MLRSIYFEYLGLLLDLPSLLVDQATTIEVLHIGRVLGTVSDPAVKIHSRDTRAEDLHDTDNDE